MAQELSLREIVEKIENLLNEEKPQDSFIIGKLWLPSYNV